MNQYKAIQDRKLTEFVKIRCILINSISNGIFNSPDLQTCTYSLNSLGLLSTCLQIELNLAQQIIKCNNFIKQYKLLQSSTSLHSGTYLLNKFKIFHQTIPLYKFYADQVSRLTKLFSIVFASVTKEIPTEISRDGILLVKQGSDYKSGYESSFVAPTGCNTFRVLLYTFDYETFIPSIVSLIQMNPPKGTCSFYDKTLDRTFYLRSVWNGFWMIGVIKGTDYDAEIEQAFDFVSKAFHL